MNETRVRLVVLGIVQGVGFRYAARDAANDCGVAGWVRNLPDGSVELEVEGAPHLVAALLAWCERGSPAALVRAVTVEERSPTHADTVFAIRR